MTPSLENKHIKKTYTGLLHTGGVEIPETTQVEVYDGNGNKTPITIGRDGIGISFTSPVKVGTLTYPSDNSGTSIGSLVCQTASNVLELKNFSTIFKEIIDLIYPIGSIYIATNTQNPSVKFIDTVWEQVSQGRFLVGVGTGTDNVSNMTFTVGNNTGEYYHRLTLFELPSHTHFTCNSEQTRTNVTPSTFIAGGGIRDDGGDDEDYVLQGSSTPSDRGLTSTVGNDGLHNNTPPGYGVYVWKRIA